MPPCIERTSIEGKRISLACVPPSVLESARVVPWTSQDKERLNAGVHTVHARSDMHVPLHSQLRCMGQSNSSREGPKRHTLSSY